MAKRVVTFNASVTLNVAAFHYNAGQNIRYREVDGVLQVRPTNRKSDVNLPKGEKLALLRRNGNSARFSGELNDVPNQGYDVVAGKYGWFTLVPSDISPAKARISDK